jgi:proline iminopeptidase
MIERTRLSLIVLLTVVAIGCSTSRVYDTPPIRAGYVRVDDSLRLFYRVYGTGGETVVLLHGGPGANFMGVGPDLLPLSEDYTLIMYDQRGGGRSDPDPNAASQTADTHVRDLETLRLFFGVERMTLIGHSWGCVLAARYAEEHPEHVERMLLIGPMEPTRELLDVRMRVQQELRQTLAEELAALEEREDLVDDPQAMCRARTALWQALYYYDPDKMALKHGDYCDAPVDFMDSYEVIGTAVLADLGDYDLRPALGAMDMPALVVEGAQARLPLDGEWAWGRALPNSRVWLMDEVGHAYPFVEQPDVFFPGVYRFMRGGWPNGARRVGSR